MQLLRSLFYLRDQTYVPDEVRKPHHLHISPVQKHIPLFCRYVPAYGKRLQVSTDAADRGAQLVGDIVRHLLLHHLVLLHVRDIVHRNFTAIVRIYQHLKGVDAAALVDIVLEDRDIVHSGIADIVSDELSYRPEYLIVPEGVEIRSRTVEHQVHELDEFGVRVDFFPFLRENGDASVVIVQMEQKPLFLQGDDTVALLQPLVASEHLVSYVAQLGIRERHVFIVHMAFLRRFRQTVQTRHALTELVREENDEEKRHEEDQHYYQYEERVGPESLFHIVFERQGHTDDIPAVRLRIVEIVYAHRIGFADGITHFRLHGLLHFGAHPVIVHIVPVLHGIEYDVSVLVDDSHPQFRREKSHCGRIVIRLRDDIGIARKPVLQHEFPAVPVASELEHYQQYCKKGENRRKVRKQLSLV